MITRIKKITFALCLALSIICFPGIVPAPAATVLPQGLVMEDTYSPGRGRPVGIVQQVLGDVVIMHGDVLKGYRAERGMRLYKGDSVMTLAYGKVRFKLNDGSILSLASETKLKLTQSVYEKKKERRSSFLQMALGKARFFVVKMLDFKRSEFKVKTPTAVCGVRGSDFILEATESETIATALVDTELEYRGLAFLEGPPMILRDFQSSIARRGERASIPVKLTQDKIEEKKSPFIGVAPETGASEDDDAMIPLATYDDTGVDQVDDLEDILPDDTDDRRRYDDFLKELKPWTPSEFDTIKESIVEEDIGGMLPDFPGSPDQQ
ncbi:MAG: FecR family protein [Desulfobacterales bacterium]|nr:FecR family protein [Desulfobacterales bacterium]MDX2513261.1 FecR family protein [Desulfobacterales bacterium]